MPVAFPRMIEEDSRRAAMSSRCSKDLEMLQAAAAEQHVAMPMSAQALTLYRLLYASGQSERDASAVVTLYPRRD